ncbi:MAG: hypothetical protein AB7D43_05200 [Sulfurimonadaceae bacterium]
MQVFKVETKNGRVFKVAIENSSQEKRFLKVINNNKGKSYEHFTSVKRVEHGIQTIKEFEALASSLV